MMIWQEKNVHNNFIINESFDEMNKSFDEELVCVSVESGGGHNSYQDTQKNQGCQEQLVSSPNVGPGSKLDCFVNAEITKAALEYFAELEKSDIHFFNEHKEKITFTGHLDYWNINRYGPKTNYATFLALCSNVLGLPNLEENDKIKVAMLTSESSLNEGELPDIEELTVVEAHNFLISKSNIDNFLILFDSKKLTRTERLLRRAFGEKVEQTNFTGARMYFARYGSNFGGYKLRAFAEWTLYAYWAGAYTEFGNLKKPVGRETLQSIGTEYTAKRFAPYMTSPSIKKCREEFWRDQEHIAAYGDCKCRACYAAAGFTEEQSSQKKPSGERINTAAYDYAERGVYFDIPLFQRWGWEPLHALPWPVYDVRHDEKPDERDARVKDELNRFAISQYPRILQFRW